MSKKKLSSKTKYAVMMWLCNLCVFTSTLFGSHYAYHIKHWTEYPLKVMCAGSGIFKLTITVIVLYCIFISQGDCDEIY